MLNGFSDYLDCRLCPRGCGINRTAGQLGACLQPGGMVLACATRHFGEEPPLAGAGGSGALFFRGCTLRCGFCQNRQLSRGEAGRKISIEEFKRICLELEGQGAENINLVSATPFIPSVEEGIRQAREAGLTLPVVWNSSGYETTGQVERLAGFVDIFLPDIKLLDPALSGRLFGAADYPEVVRPALKKMTELRPFTGSSGGKMTSGTIVRHLVLPGLLEESRRVLEWFSSELREKAMLSLMVQFYVPPELKGWRRGVAAVENRSLLPREYDQLIAWLNEFQIEEGFVQELGENETWWPDFMLYNPFPPNYSRVVWSWTSNGDR